MVNDRSGSGTGSGKFIVDCPACQGAGKVPKPGSIVLHGCLLCWERGVVSTIVAERWLKRGGQDGSAH